MAASSSSLPVNVKKRRSPTAQKLIKDTCEKLHQYAPSREIAAKIEKSHNTLRDEEIVRLLVQHIDTLIYQKDAYHPAYGLEEAFITAAVLDLSKLELLQDHTQTCLLYTSPSPRDRQKSRMPSSA